MRSTTIASGPAVRLAVTAGSVTALLAGCGGGAVRSSATTPVSRPVMLAPVSPGPSATPVPAPVPSTSATPSDLTGCRDGDCEARLREGDRIPIDPGLGVDEITVIGLREDAVRVTFTGTSTVVDGTNIGISRSCYNDRCRVRGALTISVSRPSRIGDVGLRLARVEGDTAVLVLEPAGR